MKSIYALHRQHGHTLQSFPLGRRTIATIHPQNLQLVFTDNEKLGVGPLRERASEPMIGRGIVSSDGAVWTYTRAMTKPTFNRAQVTGREMFGIHVDKFMELLSEADGALNLQPLFNRLTLDASSEFIFGENLASLEKICPGDSQRFLHSFSYAQQGVGKRVMLGKMDFLMRDRQFWESCEYIRECSQKRIDRCIAKINDEEPLGGPKRLVLAHELVKATTGRKVLSDQLLNMVFAGRDTPAVALTSVFFCIARHPGSWQKIRDLRYVQSVIKEAMRLYPPVAQTPRSCLNATILPSGGGSNSSSPVSLNPGDSISINIHSLHHSAGIYLPDPETFRPERWETIRPSWEYLPFGGGPRHCPAQQLALIWVACTVVKMAIMYKEVQNQDSVQEFLENMELNMESLDGARVRLVRA